MSTNLFKGREKEARLLIKHIYDAKHVKRHSLQPSTYAHLARVVARELGIKPKNEPSFITSMRALMEDFGLEIPDKKPRPLKETTPASEDVLDNYLKRPTDPEVIINYADQIYDLVTTTGSVVRAERGKAWSLYCMALAILIKRRELKKATRLRERLSKKLIVAKVKIESSFTHHEWNTLSDRLRFELGD